MDNTQALREAIQVAAQYTTAMSAEDAEIVEAANRAALSQPPAPEQASGEWINDENRLAWALWHIKELEAKLSASPATPEAAKPEQQAQAGDPEAWGVWLDGEPPHPWREEWFIAETIYGDLVVLRYMGDDMSYQYKTADETYMVAKNIKRWMQFPDGQYISAATKAIAKKDAALQACVKALKYVKPDYLGTLVAEKIIDAAIQQANEAMGRKEG